METLEEVVFFEDKTKAKDFFLLEISIVTF